MLKITNDRVHNLKGAILTSRYPMIVDTEEFMSNIDEEKIEEATRISKQLATSRGSEGHDQFLTGITVNFDVTGSVQWWQEAERYRFLYFVSSTSKMHRLHKMNIDKCCNEYVDEKIKDIVNCKQVEYNHALELQKQGVIGSEEVRRYFYRLIYNLPQGFEYTAGMVTNYRQLKTIYHQRKNHRLQEWKEFCKWIEKLPYSEFITGRFE